MQVSTTKEPYKNCIYRLISDLFQVDETISFLSKNQTNIWIPNDIKNPLMVNILEKPTNLVLRSYHNYIIYSDEIENLNFTLRKLKTSNIWNESGSPRGKYIIITTSKQFKQIFKLFWSFTITNVILVNCENIKSSPKLYTYSLLNSGQDIQTNFIATCNENFKIIFDPKLRNFTDCNITVVEQYSLTTDLKVVGASLGIVANVIQLVGEALKMNTSFVVTINVEEALNNKSQNIVVAVGLTLRLMLSLNKIDYSDLIVLEDAYWLIPKAPPIAKMKIIFTVFNNRLWLMIIAAFVLICVTWWLILSLIEDKENLKSFSSNLLKIFALALDNPIPFMPKHKSLRVLVYFCLFFTFEITTLYKTKLINALIDPGHEPSISSIEELARSPYKIYAINASFAPYPKKLDDKYIIVPFNATAWIMHIAYFRNCATVFDSNTYKMYPVLHSKIDRVPSLSRAEISVTMRKGHYFMETFNEIVRRITEGGLKQKFLSDAVVQNFVKDEDTSKSVLTMNHLSGIFIWWIAGLVLTLMVFLMEIGIRYIQCNILLYRNFKRRY